MAALDSGHVSGQPAYARPCSWFTLSPPAPPAQHALPLQPGWLGWPFSSNEGCCCASNMQVGTAADRPLPCSCCCVSPHPAAGGRGAGCNRPRAAARGPPAVAPPAGAHLPAPRHLRQRGRGRVAGRHARHAVSRRRRRGEAAAWQGSAAPVGMATGQQANSGRLVLGRQGKPPSCAGQRLAVLTHTLVQGEAAVWQARGAGAGAELGPGLLSAAAAARWVAHAAALASMPEVDDERLCC